MPPSVSVPLLLPLLVLLVPPGTTAWSAWPTCTTGTSSAAIQVASTPTLTADDKAEWIKELHTRESTAAHSPRKSREEQPVLKGTGFKTDSSHIKSRKEQRILEQRRREREKQQQLEEAEEEGNAGPTEERSGRQLQEVFNLTAHRDNHQIVFINLETAKLEVNDNARIWGDLANTKAAINVVVIYGDVKTGRSTLASMLACSMNRSRATLFPASTDTPPDGSPRKITEGIWSSDPFQYTVNDGGQQVTKSFIIVDMQGLNNGNNFGGLSSKITEHAVIKMVSMLTEVASVFVFSTQSSWLERSDMDKLSLAFRTMRDSLVTNNPDDEAPIDENVRIKSFNSPGLLVALRRNPSVTIVDGDTLTYDKQYFDDLATSNFKSNADPNWKALLLANFKNYTGTDTEETKIPFHYNPMPYMDMQRDGDSTMLWATKEQPYADAKGGACAVYDQLDSSLYQCKLSPVASPAAPPVYKLMIDNLAERIHLNAPNRMVSWGDFPPQDLTGMRLKGFLEASVKEINAAGPLPDNELWRIVMQDRCARDIDTWVNNSLGNLGNGIVLQMQAMIVPARAKTWSEDELNALKTSLVTMWSTIYDIWDQSVESWFNDRPLMTAVKPQCIAEGRRMVSHWNLISGRIQGEVDTLTENAKYRRSQSQVADLQAQLQAAGDRINQLFWEKWAPYIAVGTIAGLFVLYYLWNIFSQCCMTCKTCCFCCNDLSTQDNTQKVVYIDETGGGGTEMTGLAAKKPARGAAVAVGVAATASSANVNGGSSNSVLMARVEDLEALILQMATRLPPMQPSAPPRQQYLDA